MAQCSFTNCDCGFESRCCYLNFRFDACLDHEFLGIHATIQCRLTLKLVHGMIITYSQMDGTDNYSQDSSIIWPVWLNGLVFVHELSGPGFESRHWSKCSEIANIGTVLILIMQGIWSSHLTFCLNLISVFG